MRLVVQYCANSHYGAEMDTDVSNYTLAQLKLCNVEQSRLHRSAFDAYKDEE